MRTRLILFVVVLSCFALNGLHAPTAQAKQKKEFEYPYEYVWNTIVRFIRVDAGFPIKDRDVDAGYVLFEYQDGGRAVPGTAEVLKVSTSAGPRIRVIFQIPSMPSYVETMLIQKLSRKLLEEYGEPMQSDKPRKDRPRQDTLPEKTKPDEEPKPEKDEKLKEPPPKK